MKRRKRTVLPFPSAPPPRQPERTEARIAAATRRPPKRPRPKQKPPAAKPQPRLEIRPAVVSTVAVVLSPDDYRTLGRIAREVNRQLLGLDFPPALLSGLTMQEHGENVARDLADTFRRQWLAVEAEERRGGAR